MAEQERLLEKPALSEMDPKVYYDYEQPFIKMKQDRDRIDMLPRIVKPPLFRRNGHALGDIRVFDRFTVGPITSLTCEFVTLGPGQVTPRQRLLPAQVCYVLEGDGESIQEGERFAFEAGDLIVVPPYTTHHLVAGGRGVSLYVPQTRLWHMIGLLWQEQLEFTDVPRGADPIYDADRRLQGLRIPRGVLDLDEDLEIRAEPNARLQAVFAGRRSATARTTPRSRYERFFLQGLADENQAERTTTRVVRGADLPWEETRQGRLKYYLSTFSEGAARALDFAAMDIPVGHHSGEHRHIFEELVYVQEGSGYDVHDGTQYPWSAGDLICIPTMVAHSHVNSGQGTVRLLATWPRYLANEYLGGIEHLSDAVPNDA